MRVRAVRGAITVERDEPATIVAATSRLLRETLAANAIESDDIVSIVFTATEDLASAFPAAAARELGLADTPVLCAREMSVDGGLPRVVRMLLHFHTERSPREVRSVYLEGARALRPDLG